MLLGVAVQPGSGCADSGKVGQDLSLARKIATPTVPSAVDVGLRFHGGAPKKQGGGEKGGEL